MVDPVDFTLSVFGKACCEPGNLNSNLTPSFVGIILWGGLCLHEALSQRKGNLLRRQFLLPGSFFVCLLVEVLLFSTNAYLMDNTEPTSRFQVYWPLLEFMLLTMSRLLLAAAFLDVLFDVSRPSRRFLWQAGTALLLVFLIIALNWIARHAPEPQLQFADTAGSVWLKASAVILISVATLSISASNNRNRWPVLTGFILLWIDSVLTLFAPDVLAFDRNQGSPVHGNLSNLSIIVLGYACMKLRHASERKLEKGIQTSERLEALGQLSSGIAHDFNNHLQVILGYVELAGTQSSDPHALRQSLKRVEEAAEAAGDLVNQLLTFSRGQKTEYTVLDLNEVIMSLSPMLSRLLGPDTTLRHDLDLKIAPIRADKRMVEQVLFNLVINARDAMADGGIITISSHALIRQGKSRRGEAGDSCTRMTVADTGCGMDKATLRRAFEPFYTTKPVGEGTGLGLTTVYGIVKKHAAHIHIDSSPGECTHVHIDFPVTTELLVAEPSQSFPVMKGNGETILLTEDEVALRDLARTFLTASGYHVLIANDGQHAINIASTYHGKIDLCLFDVIMPRLNGYETYDRISALDNDIPALFVTGSTSRAEKLRQQYPHLQKPYTGDTLLKSVRATLNQTATV
ncbi:ATP-binding protein [Granulosicoccus sp. 3-233]|uniref:ATP-binding protein n=1 Tax=Granulosicoccus sp. 3-233 TaxID=3417969 RepID=UPI003D34FB20